MATVLPFHRLVVDDPAFAAATERASPCTPGGSRPSGTTPSRRSTAPRRPRRPAPRQRVVVEVGGRRLEVSLPGDLALGGGAARRGGGAGHPQARRARARRRPPATRSPRRCRARSSRSRSSDGDTVAAGDLVVVLEAMKMENPVTAHKAGTVTSLAAEAGSSVTQGTVLCEIKD